MIINVLQTLNPLNAGSSNSKFALYKGHEELQQMPSGTITNIESKNIAFTIKEVDANHSSKQKINASNFYSPIISLID